MKTSSFIGDDKINLSWMEPPKNPQTSNVVSSVKRPQPSTNGNNTIKKGRFDGGQNQLMNKTFEGISRGGGRGRGRGWGGRERGEVTTVKIVKLKSMLISSFEGSFLASSSVG